MKVHKSSNNIDINNKKISKPNFKGTPMAGLVGLATYLDERVLLGKAVLDVTALDAPQIIMANNNQERREKFNKVSCGFILGYLSPLVTLPLTNRLAMKHIAKLTKNFVAKDSNIIQLSNKYLVNKEETQKGIELLSKKLKTDYKPLLEKVGRDYEVLRKKLINAKNSVLAFDFLFTSASIGSIGFFNNWQTKRKTKQDGYSAEFSMADKDIVQKRAESFKKKEPLRKMAWLGTLTTLTLSPLLIRKGLTSQKTTAFNNYIKKISAKFDYTDGIFMSRLPLFIASCAIYSGIVLASRNQTEMKDTSIRSTASAITFWGGDIIIGSILGRLSDKYLKTDLIKKDIEKSFLNKLIPPTKRLRDLNPRDKKIGAALYWLNLAILSVCMGFGIPYLINKMIKKDVQKDILANNSIKTNNNILKYSETFKNFKMGNAQTI